MSILRDLFRGLQVFEAFYENDRIEMIRDPHGVEWTIWDVKYLYEARRHLSPRQREAIEMCLYDNIKESDAALLMGIEPTSPVCVYANNGLKKIISMIDSGQLPKFLPERVEDAA